MSGNATFAGTTYQSRVIALVYVHILAQMRLGWLAPYDDTPIAVAGETEGPGDDARIEFGDRIDAIEVQAKHGLTGGAKLDEVIDRLVSHSKTDGGLRVVLAVNRDSSRTVTREFAGDLNRLRSGRRDGLKAETKRVLDKLGGDASILERLFVAVVDVDREQEPEMKLALHLLEQVLEEPAQAIAAMGLLVSDASEVCARKLNRTRKDLVTILTEAKIRVRAPPRDERWLRQLDFSKQLLDNRYAQAALAVLRQMESALGDTSVEPTIRYRLFHQIAVAQLQLGRFLSAYESAQKALEFDASGLKALVAATAASLELGDLEKAKTLSQRAMKAHPHAPQAWGLQVRLASASGEPMPQPSSLVAGSPEYRAALVQAATLTSDWSRVIEITEGLIAEDPFNPILRLQRADALLSISTGTSAEDRVRGEDAERLTSTAIDLFADDAHPLMPYALAVRASARRFLGRVEEADADLSQAQQLDSNDPNVIDQIVKRRLDENDQTAAFELLRQPVVEKVPALLTLRANLHALRNEPDAARRDIEAALSRISDADDTELVRLQAAEAALNLLDVELSERVLSSIEISARQKASYAALCGRLAFLKNNPEQGETYFRNAAAQDTVYRPQLLTELGIKLLRRGDIDGGLKALNEVGVAEMPPGAHQDYGSALQDAGDFRGAQQLVDFLAAHGPLPDWALSLATNIALRQENAEAAISHLQELLARGQQPTHTKIVLANLLLENDRTDDARWHVDELVSDKNLTAVERMQVAQLLLPLRRPKDALMLAFRAFRDAPNDPKIHRAFILAVLSRDMPRDEVDEVGTDTYVRLRGPSGEILERTIFTEPPFDPLHGQISLADAQAMGLIGKRVGDTIASGRLNWNEKRFIVEEIKPAVVSAAQDAMSHFEDRFPQEPFFMTGFSLGDLSSVGTFAPLIASLEARKAHARTVQALYREHLFPLEVIARMLSIGVSELMRAMTTSPHEFGLLMVEWMDAAGQQQSRLAALRADEVVLTRSALQTAHELQILDRLSSLKIIAPRSLLRELRDEVKEAAHLVSSGQRMLAGGEQGFGIHDLEPGHPFLVERSKKAHAQLQWLEASVRVVSRPLATINQIGSREEEIRDTLGHSSADARALAQHSGSALYADDLGLRRILDQSQGARSFSTITLLPVLAERGLISSDECSRMLLSLVARHYAAVLPSVELLLAALRERAAFGWANVKKVFDLLGGASVSAAESANIAVQVMKKLVVAPVQVIDIERVVELALEGLRGRWPVPLCVQLVRAAANNEFYLLPQYLELITRVSARYLKNTEI